MVKISDCFHYIITLLCYVMKLAGMIGKLDRFLEILQIVQCNLQTGWPIYQLADWPDWTDINIIMIDVSTICHVF